jgi:molybdate transport system substrate-binding protein
MKFMPSLLPPFTVAALLPGLIPLLLPFLMPQARADEIKVAVAANFSSVMPPLIERFRQQSGHTVVTSFGASGKFYAQIRQGAPFDAMLSADSATPKKLIEDGIAQEDSLRTYAIGQLVLWSAKNDFVDANGNILRRSRFAHLALAQPRLAPYGLAAQQVLEKLKLWQDLQPRLVYGENIGQTWQFIDSGNAELGFIALSQLPPARGSHWLVPEALYQPLRQQMVILQHGKNSPATRQFWQFMQSGQARSLIATAGYRLDESASH